MTRLLMCVVMVAGLMVGPAVAWDDGWLDRETQRQEMDRQRGEIDRMRNDQRNMQADMERQRQEMDQQRSDADRLRMEMEAGVNRYGR